MPPGAASRRTLTQPAGIMNTHRCIAMLVACLAPVGFARAETVLLGVQEELPGVHVGESSSNKVRALFSHGDAGWSAFPSDCPNAGCLKAATRQYPHEVTWFVALDGRQVGKVVGRTPDEFRLHAHVGLQDIVGGQAPVVGKPSAEFGSFAADKLHRPLVTVSRPYFKDPAVWKRAKVTPQILNQALTAFRSKVPRACKEGPSGDLVPFPYTQGDLEVRAHKSSRGALVMTVWLENARECDAADGEGLVTSRTFSVSEAGTWAFLGEGLLLVDAGDYDNDGQSELLFSLSGYNQGGYVLFSAADVELARFEFSYH